MKKSNIDKIDEQDSKVAKQKKGPMDSGPKSGSKRSNVGASQRRGRGNA